MWKGEEVCRTCRFWSMFRKADDLGTCQRHPPVLDLVHALVAASNGDADAVTDSAEPWVQPVTLGDDRCGEHKPDGEH